jgi:hypothetical protein
VAADTWLELVANLEQVEVAASSFVLGCGLWQTVGLIGSIGAGIDETAQKVRDLIRVRVVRPA